MTWLQQHAWWGLLVIPVAGTLAALDTLATGVTWQAEDVTGVTFSQIAVESSAGAQLAQFSVRTGALYLIVAGVLQVAILLSPFREGRAWAWWVMWTGPALALGTSLLLPTFGTPGPSITALVVAAVSAAILLVSAPRFLRRPAA